MSSIHLVTATALIGIGATAVMDGWAFLLSRLGVPSAGFGMVGRWIGHMPRGRFAHDAIAKAAPVRNELGLGWLTHYAVGIAYAALLVALQGSAWLDQPTILPAVAVGVATLAAPWFLIQPAMGSGFMASKTPSPLQNRLRSLANHAVFGVGLYLAAAALARVVA